MAVALLLTGCIDKSDADPKAVDFARTGAITTLVLTPQTPGHPHLKGFLETAYQAEGITSPATETDNPRELSSQVDALVSAPPATLVVELGKLDQPQDSLRKLVKAGTSVLCLGQRPAGKNMCTAFVGWDDWAGGYLESVALTEALGETQGRRWNVESIGLAPGDKAGQARLRGSIFQRLPHRATSPTITKTGRLSYTQLEVPGARPEGVTQQLVTTIQATFLTQPMDGLVLPSDLYIDAAREAFEKTGRPLPLMVSAGATPEGLQALADDQIVATQYQDPEILAHEVAVSLSALRAGRPLVTSPRRNWENRLSGVPAVFVTPVNVTRANAASTLANAPELLELLQ